MSSRCVPTFIRRGFAERRAVKGVAAVAKTREIDVEKDAYKLVNFCCINYRIDDQPIPLKPDSEYPDWLWSIRVSRRPPKLVEIDPDSYYYWRRIRRLHNRHLNNLAAADGWHRREHRDPRSHSDRSYGDLAYALKKWLQQQANRL
ncbi:39S ribosomal protein L54, mitochondrial [Echinococcus granulosus]|uniref:Large ribosomal subunit protein mL54 n=1 Tax=Echinococcus granulosus TaxID=6210 RepID=U6JFE6_ECHGR|nr:39S ribosomal protein L54 [Echinococcus granulosus]EUB56686.1 39S ribosomal protein L54 [Echinococcus granulosus]KAH9287072.1 39S ribosomal protein L54, mitochondrial [Echinococcus granulosus]CDS22822.1 Ribosomal protein L37 mitochondrial [Echinococcus granulosus]